MPTRTISLDEEAYERLRAEKRDGESFSDVVKRLTGERSWSGVAGIWSDETDDLEAAIEREDCAVAATTLAEDEPVVTRNVDNFEPIPEVEVRSY